LTEPNSMPPSGIDSALPELPRIHAVVLVLDLVESVRLMQRDESGVIQRWRNFVKHSCESILPMHHGRLVKSLGDGMLVAFDTAPQAVSAALACHALIEQDAAATPAELHMHLRAGVHGTHVFVGKDDIYGAGVNLAARLASLAGPGETVVSATVRDELADGLDVNVVDLGECEALGDVYLKHVDGPVRAYRVGSAGSHPIVTARSEYATPFGPTIAVIPFVCRNPDPDHMAAGELIGDGIIAHLCHARHLRVISRLSTTVFRGREASMNQIERVLGATFVLSGSYNSSGNRLVVNWELADTTRQHVLAGERVAASISDLFDHDSHLVHGIALAAHDAILGVAVNRVQTQPLPTLESYALLLGGIQLLHRSSRRDFDLSFKLFGHLAERHPRAIEPRVWQAKWYALRAVQGLSIDTQGDARAALACTAHALDQYPGNSFALAMEGFVHCHLSRDFDAARARLSESVALNPSETFGQLFYGVLHGMLGHFDLGMDAYEVAAATSPLDPARYLLDSIGAYLYLGAHEHRQAIKLAQQSLRLNRLHAHSWRILTVAQSEIGEQAAAQESLRQVLALQPDLTVKSYLAGARSDDPTRRRFAAALQAAGLAAN
jgi:adenylate cyclase